MVYTVVGLLINIVVGYVIMVKYYQLSFIIINIGVFGIKMEKK